MIRQQFSNVFARFDRNRNHPSWLRFVIPPILLVIVALLAFGSPRTMILGLIGACVGVGGLIILLRHMSLGVVMLIVASMLVPFTIGTGTGTSINATILLLGLIIAAWIVDMVVIQKEIKLVKSTITMPLLAFVVVSFMAFISGQVNWFPAVQGAPIMSQLGGLAIFLLSAAAFFIVPHVIKQPHYLAWMTWLFFGIAGVYIFARLLPPQYEFMIRRFFPNGSDASLFWVWLLSMAGAQALFNNQLSRIIRLLSGFLVLAAIYVSLIQAYDWKSGWMPALVGLMVVIWVGAPRYRILAVLGALMVILMNFSSISSILTGQEDYSLSTRTEAWRIVFDIAMVNPITGLGFANYYWFTPLYVIMGYRVKFNSHNNYLDLLAQTGIIGILVFFWFAAQNARLGWNLLGKVPEGFDKAYVIGALGGLVGTLFAGMLGDWFLPFVYNVGLVGFRSSVFFWLFLGGLVVYEQYYCQPAAPDRMAA